MRGQDKLTPLQFDREKTVRRDTRFNRTMETRLSMYEALDDLGKVVFQECEQQGLSFHRALAVANVASRHVKPKA